MPWQHCGQLVMDNVACPACGREKDTWTIKHERTRVFRLAPAEEEPDQIEVLKKAAEDGSPFCEKCEKARMAEQEPSEPYEGDQEAQVEALKEAAQDGAPFCEKCEQARQQEATAEVVT